MVGKRCIRETKGALIVTPHEQKVQPPTLASRGFLSQLGLRIFVTSVCSIEATLEIT